jgi:outer membrane protein assembly factor BamB
MKRNISQLFTILVLFFFVNLANGLEQWQQWRGPNRDGITNLLPRQWPEQLTKQWQIQIGEGHSSPVVWKDRVFTFTREGEEEVVRAIDIATGRVQWRSSYPAPYEVYPGAAGYGAGPRSTPVITSQGIFTLGISGIFSAFDPQTGKLKWQKQFQGKFAESAPPFGASMSPAIAENLVIAHVGGHKGGALIAFDQQTERKNGPSREKGQATLPPSL